MHNLSRYRRHLAVGASLVALMATPALAENEAPASPPADASSAGAVQGGDIIVTAQRRSERLRDVPISITAVTAETLSKAGISNTLELSRVAVGVELPLYGGFVRPSIRGISSGLSSLGDSSNVALYIDGVYQPSESGQLADMPDVQSVQILKGPQGSLYGQNAAGGAIIIDTLSPSLGKSKGLISAGYGNYNDKQLRGYYAGPLGPTLATAVSAAWHDHDGYNKDLLRGGHDKGLRSWQIRGKLLWQPSANLSFTLGAYYTKRNDSGIYTGAPYKGNSAGNAAIRNFPLAYPGVAVASKPHTFAENFIPTTNIKAWGVSLLGKIGLGDIGTLNTTTAYQKTTVFDQTDIDQSAVHIGSSQPLNVGSKAFIQELNFASNKLGRLTINAGVFFMNRQESYDPQLFNLYFGGLAYPKPIPAPGFIIGSYSRNKKSSYAVYLEASYDITDTLTLTAAGRYSYETQKAFNSIYPDPSYYPDPRGSFNFKKFTPKAVLRWKPDNNNMVYFSYSQGFKSGLVGNGRIGSCPGGPKDASCLEAPVKPEVVEAFEIGYKGRVTEGLNISAAAFQYTYSNIQVFVYNPLGGSFTQNAAKGRVRGLELEGSFKATSDLSFNFGISYLKSEYLSFPGAAAYRPKPNVAPGVPCLCGNDGYLVNAKGNRLVHAPKLTANLSVDYSHRFSAGTLGLNVNGNYDAGYFHDANNRIKTKAYGLLSAELSFAPAGIEGLRFVLWGKNLTDHDYLQSVLQTNFADAVSWSPPRTVGGRVEFAF